MSWRTTNKGLPGPVNKVAKQRTPVIVTFDENGEVFDTFGDILHYAETKDELVRLLTDLLDGRPSRVETLAEVAMPSGYFADVGVVPEGALRHVVLLDVTSSVIERREVLQASHETALAERRNRAGLERQLKSSVENGGRDESGHLEDTLQVLSWDMRARLDEIQGHAQVLDSGVFKPSTEANAISSIKRTAMHLHAYVSACIACLNGMVASDLGEPEPIDLGRMAAELQGQFGQAPHLPRVSFEIGHRLGDRHVVVLEYNRIYQVLVCLVACVLDATSEALDVRISTDGTRFIAEFTPDLGEGDEADNQHSLQRIVDDPRYAASHIIAASLGGRLTNLKEHGAVTRLELVLDSVMPPAQTGRSESGHCPSMVLVAVDEPPLRDRIASLLSDLGLSARECDDLNAVEREAVGLDVAMIILGGAFASADGIGLSYRLHARGARQSMVLLRRVAGLSPSTWLFDGRRTIVSSDVDDDVLRTAIKGALQP